MFREQIIIKYIAGKDVLDVGSCGQSSEYCLWDVLKEHAGSLSGIDLPTAGDAAETQLGLAREHLASDERIVSGNMETHDFGRAFDVITACDVLEHVSNQGSFLCNIRRHLNPQGRLILTTPNAKWLTVAFRPNATHTLWRDRYTLEAMLGRCGLRIVEFHYYVGNKPHYGLLKRLLCWRQSMLAVCARTEEGDDVG